MTYKRYKSNVTLSKQQKKELVAQYISYYKDLIADRGIEVLNIKLPREVFEPILDQIGTYLNEQAKRLASEEGEVKQFLDDNPLPPQTKDLLPDEFRAFSLLLNALKQWVSAESAATDRYILGGTARDTCRSAVDHCIVTGETLGDRSELHHPMRDGRPPILLSKKGHSMIEHQLSREDEAEIPNDNEGSTWNQLKKLKRDRHSSWILLREGCEAILKEREDCRTNAKSIANKVIKELKLSPHEIIELMDQKGV